MHTIEPFEFKNYYLAMLMGKIKFDLKNKINVTKPIILAM